MGVGARLPIDARLRLDYAPGSFGGDDLNRLMLGRASI